jgi:hypothetical protein
MKITFYLSDLPFKVHPLLGRNAVSGVQLLQKVAGLRACSQPG